MLFAGAVHPSIHNGNLSAFYFVVRCVLIVCSTVQYCSNQARASRFCCCIAPYPHRAILYLFVDFDGRQTAQLSPPATYLSLDDVRHTGVCFRREKELLMMCLGASGGGCRFLLYSAVRSILFSVGGGKLAYGEAFNLMSILEQKLRRICCQWEYRCLMCNTNQSR